MQSSQRAARVIGVDPGLAVTGIGMVTGSGPNIAQFSYGCIQTSNKKSLPERLGAIYNGIIEVLTDVSPDFMVVEDAFVLDRYPKSGLLLGKVLGVILLAGHQKNVPVMEIPVREAKQVLTGNGNASKMQLERTVRRKLKLTEPIRPDHASDALAMAIIGLLRNF